METENPLKKFETEIRKIGLAYPEAYEEFPWGHCALKVNKKAFAFLGLSDESFSISMKLPVSKDFALALPFASPTGYGLGKSGWVSSRFGPNDDVPVGLLQTWLEESYRTIAPKRVSAKLVTK
jgi:predicted DNA-binding protein (MmcQ/YjbR family)